MLDDITLPDEASTSTPRRPRFTPSRDVPTRYTGMPSGMLRVLPQIVFSNGTLMVELRRHHTHPVTTAERGETTPGSAERFEAVQRALTMPARLNTLG